MKKNLKKVISLVSAFAMAASTFAVSTSAKVVTPPDVVGTQYEQAVTELVALGVVTGYEDGSYQPENNITRAEVTKLVVDAMGPRYHQNAEAAAGKDTQFTDVLGTHWAAGYVSTGVANNFIAGMGDGTFAPEENVTYAQIVKMIIAAMGYTSICEKQGGYPNGYIAVASQQGVTAGVTGVGADTVVTRGQVAVLLDNAVKLPIVAITGYEESEYTGQLIAQTQIMDDINGVDAKDYQTLLTKNHDAYVVKGRITDTSKSAGDSLKTGEVRFNVEATNNFDDTAYGASYAAPTNEVMYYDGDDADSLMFVYAEAIVAKDDNDEYTILTITPVGNNETVELSGALYDSNKADGADVTSIDMFQSENSTKTKTYKMDPNAQIYVNGVSVGDLTPATVDAYIDGNNNGTVTFIDTTDTAKTTTDGKIDFVLVTYYADAIVDSVQTNAKNYKVFWKNQDANIRELTIDPEDDDVTVTFTKNGEEIQYTDLNEYDVVSIAYDVNKAFKDSSFYEVLVSDKRVTGKVSAKSKNSNDEPYYTIGGTNYTASHSIYDNPDNVLAVGTEYEVYLNAFDNIAYYDEDSSSKVVGIIDYANVDSSDTPKIRVITSAGTKASYTVKDNSKTTFKDIVSKFVTTDPSLIPTDAGTAALTTTTKKPLEDLVCEYTINSNGYITKAVPLSTVKAFTADDGEYKASTKKLGSYALADSTVIIDLSTNTDADLAAQNYSKVKAASVSDLSDGDKYAGVVAEKSSADSTYRFVVITDGGSAYTGNTPFYVYSKGGSVYDDNQGSSVDTLIAYGPEAETVELLLDSSNKYSYDKVNDFSKARGDVETTATNLTGLKRGDVFVYDTDSEDYVTEVKVIFKGIGDNDYFDFLNDAISVNYNAFADEDLFTDNLYPVNAWLNTKKSDKAGEVGFVFGPIMDRIQNNVYLGKIITYNGKKAVNTDETVDYTVLGDANIYVYDFTATRADDKLYKGTIGNVVKTNAPKTFLDGAEDEITYVETTDYAVNFIVAKTVDGDITDALVIIGSTD